MSPSRIFLLALVAVVLYASAAYAVTGGGSCVTNADCLSGTTAKDLANAAVDSNATCSGGVCINCGANQGSHCQCRAASGSACALPPGNACSLQWNLLSPGTPPTVNPPAVCNDCPGNCSGHGICNPNLTCTCIGGYSGPSCSVLSNPSAFLTTGVNNNGVVLPPGNVDPHWIVFGPAPGIGPAAYTDNPHPAWLANNALSSWINPSSIGDGTASFPPGNYLYVDTFDYSSLDPTTTTVSLLFASDNDITSIVLNGNPKPLPTPGVPFSFSTFSAPYALTGWVKGVNQLVVTVNNATATPGPTGFRVQATVTTASPGGSCVTNSDCLNYSLGARASNGGIIDGGFCTTAGTCSCTYSYAPLVPTGNIGSRCQCRKDAACGQGYGVWDVHVPNGNSIGCAATAADPQCA